MPFWIKKAIFPLLAFQLFFLAAFAQKAIKGTVTDSSGRKLIGVTVKVEQSDIGATTDADGAFTMTVPDNAVLKVSYVGYQTREIALNGRSSIHIIMNILSSGLDQVVIIGYGTQTRNLVTTSISKLDNKVLENIPYSNVASALEGTVPGVRVQSTSGQPGAEPRVIVRGGTSINNPDGSTPLYVIDGVIRDDMNGINPSDIESVQVLKDAASTAIYGARGSNGVVLITTKSGVAGKTKVSFSYNSVFSNVAKQYDFVSAKDFIYYMRMGYFIEGRLSSLTATGPAGTGNDLTNNTTYTPQYLTPENKYKLDEGWESMPDPIDSSKTIIFKNTNFQDVLFRTGISNNYNLSVSGGTDKATFNLGVGYLTNKGIAITSYYNRLSLNFNGDFKVRDNLSFFGRLMYSGSHHKDVFGNLNSMFGRSIATPPTTKYMYEDGTLAPGASNSIGNPAYYSSTQDTKNTIDYLTMIIGSHWEILPGLSFDPQVSLLKTTNFSRLFQKAYFNGPTAYVDTRQATESEITDLSQQVNAVFSYNKSFDAVHNIDVTAGFSYLGINNSNFSASGWHAATDLIPTLNASAEPTAVDGLESNMVTMGYFSRVNYNYKQKYLVSVSARYDGASNLGDKNKWGLFPAVSLGWNLHKENFWQQLFPRNILQMKLRGSYGVTGNISGLGPYEAQGEFSVGNRYDDNAAIENTAIANQKLQWEQSKTLDGGVDLRAFDNRVGVIFDYYKRVTNHLLTNLNLPRATGFESIFTNLGSLQNKGMEIQLNIQVIPVQHAFQWNVTFNSAKVKSTILRLPDNGIKNNRIGGVYVWDSKAGGYTWQGGLQEGGTIGDLFAYKQIGIYPTDKAASTAPVDMLLTGVDKTKYGGDVEWLDKDKNDTIDSRDQVYMGNIYPTWTGGVTSSFSFKNFSLDIRLDYTLGHTIYNYTGATSIGQFQGGNNLSKEVLRSWKKQGDITDIPRFYWADQQAQNNLYRGNSQFYESGDFLAVREVTLAYNFPQQVLNRIKMSSLRLYLTGNNLYYFTSYSGLNPEGGGTDNGRYPLPRNIIVGLNLTF